MCDGFELGSMTEDEDRAAVEAQIRTVIILHDALNKQRWLLAEPGRDYGPEAANVPLICPQLVEDLIQTLQQVEILKYLDSEDGDGAIYPAPSAAVIGLSTEFWQRHENLRFCSRPGALIMAAACILGYHNYDESHLMDGMEENQRRVLRATHISDAFEVWMKHKGNYVNGSYSCCGETSEHSVCEDSDMRFFLHCIMDEEQEQLAETSRKATLRILDDVWNKKLCKDNSHPELLQQSMVPFPLISVTLLADLMKKVEKVTFKCDNKPRNETLIAYPGAQEQDVIYLCPLFWKQSDRLRLGSRIGTLILCASQMLGYSHVLDGTNKPEEPMGCQERDLLTADDICAAFELWMRHREPYLGGSYSCCGEGNEISVCRESLMALGLRQCLLEVTYIINGDANPCYSNKEGKTATDGISL